MQLTKTCSSVSNHSKTPKVAGMNAEKKIEELLKEYAFNPFKIKENSKQKVPDYKVLKNNVLKFYCEVKNIEKDNSSGLRSDSIFNRLTSHIHNAAKQLNSFNSNKNIYNVIALYNEDKLCGIDDLRAVLT